MREYVDLAYINYGHTEEVWQKLQDYNRKHMEGHPVCEICHNRPSVRITPVGTLKAACLECIADIYRLLDEDLAESLADQD